jgi:hypothetical protein
MTHRKPEQGIDDRSSHVYVLRLWREAARSPWRLSLREADKQMIGFGDLDELVLFLLRTMNGTSETALGQATTDDTHRPP